MAVTSGSQIEQLLGDEAQALLSYEAQGVPQAGLSLPGPDFIDRVMVNSDRPVPVLRNLAQV
ncbi:MAG: fructose-bisphosphate aldolase, class, partial [Gaiellales bacterium]|nr:fructose-bisphosphate aldolase, class [Gaiellales bacterium]